jgi:hypothetical protein
MKALVLGLALTVSSVVAADNLLYVMDIVLPGSSLPFNYFNATGGVYQSSGPGMLTSFGMRQMHMRGREIRRRYITEKSYLSAVSNPDEYYAYALDGDATYRSAMSFMTGLYPGKELGPKPLLPNQTAIAKPPIALSGAPPPFDTALPNNFQTVPIHSDVGNLNSTVYQGWDSNICPIIGEIQLRELSQKNSTINQTFTEHSKFLFGLFTKKGLKLPEENLIAMTLTDFYSIVREIW